MTPDPLDKNPDDIDQPKYEVAVQQGKDGWIELLCKSVYGSYETISTFPMSPMAGIILAHLLLKESLIATNVLEPEEDEEDGYDEGEVH